MAAIALGADPLGIDDVVAVARGRREAELAPDARRKMMRSREVVDRFTREDRPVYGLTRGLGARVVHEIGKESRDGFSRIVVLARACGAEPYLPGEAVRAALVARASSLAQGGAGVRPLIVETQCAMLNAGVHPLVPSIGSTGASDLALLANLALPVIGEGRAEFRGEVLAGADAMARAGIATVEPAEKEGLALCSANSVSAGLGALVLHDAAHLAELADAIAVLTFEAFRANPSPIDPRVVRARGAPGQARAAASLREKLNGSRLFEAGEPRRVQDPISLRCVSHVHGSLRAAIDFCAPNVLVELNGAGDNPLVLMDDDEILSNGNFHTPAMAVAFDTLALATGQVATLGAQRISRMMKGEFTDLPDGLTRHGTTHAGVALMALTSEMLVKEVHMKAQPASVHDSMGYAVEDHAPMTLMAVRKAGEAFGFLEQIMACELIASAQAFDLRAPAVAAPVARALRDKVREAVEFVDQDRSLTPNLAAVTAMLRAGAFDACLDAGND
jgi:histidine ammonia-lyase